MKNDNVRIGEMVESGKLIQVVVIDSEGMVIESVGDLYDPEMLSSIFFPFQGFVGKIREDLKVDGVEELSVRTEGRRFRIVLRHFKADGMKFFIVAICPLTSYYRQIMNEITQIFYNKLKTSADEETYPGLMEAEEEIEKEMEMSLRDYEFGKDQLIPSEKKSGLAAEIKEVVAKIAEEIKQEEAVSGEKPLPEISEETIDLISYRLVKRLSFNIIEKMTHKIILQIAENLVKKEISRIKKEIESLFST